MSTTVSYKGNTIATLNNETKTLTTAGTWVEGNIEITDSGVGTNGVFYVYKSSNCTIHRIPILDVDDWTFDLTSLVSSGYLYGGYFSSFGGSSQDWTSSDLEEVTFTNDVYTDSLGTPYTATVANVWKDDIAYTACGIALTPVSNTIYYIKEVPNDYLRLQFITMYNNSNVLTHLYMYTAIDDAIARYKGVIFNPVLECQTFALMINHNGSYLTPKSLFDGVTYPDKTISVSRGYLNSMSGANPSYGTIDLSNYSANDTLTITPSWVTLDNVNVYGVITATIDFGDFTDDSTTGIKVSYTLKTGDKVSVYSKITTLSNLTVTPGTSSQTFTGATQYDGYKSVVVNAMPSGSATTPATTITANPSISVDSSTGLITATASASQSITPTVVAGYINSGTAGTVTVSGSNTSQLSIQTGTTITPNESEQTAVSAGKYTTGAVKVGAISSTYVGSGIDRRDETDLTASGSTVTVPAGFYAEQETKSVASGTEGTPTATKGTVSNHSISVTPSVTNTTGYITGSTKTGTAVTVTASELASGNKEITQNGTNIDVVGYSTVSVAVPSSSTAIITDTTDAAGGTIRTITTTDEVHLQTKTITPTSTQQTVTPDTGYDGFSSVIVGASSGGGSSNYTRTTIATEQTVTPTSTTSDGNTYYSAQLNLTSGLESGEEYIITYNGTEYFYTCRVLWGTNYLLGEINYFYGTTGLPYPFGILWESGTTCRMACGDSTAVTVKIEKLEFVGTPSATAHTIYFEFSDGTDTTITAYYDDSFISDAITATTPTTYGQKTVTLAELDGVAWYEYDPSETWETVLDGNVAWIKDDNNDYPYCWIPALSNVSIPNGSVWRITYDNVEYRLTAVSGFIGNPKWSSGTDDGTNVPFVFNNPGWGAWTGSLNVPNVDSNYYFKIERLVS